MADPADSAPAIQVVPDHVLDAGKYVQLTADNLVNALRDLDTDIDAVLEVWKGNSATAYRAGWDETKQGAVRVLEALATIAELLGVTTQTFVEQDDSNSRSYPSLNL
ncbi:WXG100 family type VII secretion target [Nocardia sienata]|uniref:WXG100 family type VII secretion target n=1 Tax=Nocardia sienata TaxID=248552 RepID=UPI0007A4CE45|nr:WXG100 family type VII secretion target [Nocardia sienata]